jgi:hypothetical protein
MTSFFALTSLYNISTNYQIRMKVCKSAILSEATPYSHSLVFVIENANMAVQFKKRRWWNNQSKGPKQLYWITLPYRCCCPCVWSKTMSLNRSLQRACCSSRGWYMSVESQGGVILAEENRRKPCPSATFVHHKSCMDWLGCEPRRPWWEADD